MNAISQGKRRYVLRHFNDSCIGKDRLATALNISKKSVYNIYNQYKDCKLWALPQSKPCGRKPYVFMLEEVDTIIDYRNRFKVNCNTLQELISTKEKMNLSHNQIYKIVKLKGLIHVQKPKKKRNTWVRFERKHSLSLWQTDWTKLENGNWLMAIKDDASRLIVAYGEFSEATSDHSIEVLTLGIKTYGRPKAILTGRDTQFYASSKKGKPSGKKSFPTISRSQRNPTHSCTCQSSTNLWKNRANIWGNKKTVIPMA